LMPNAAKLTSLLFVYRKVEMKTTSSTFYGRGAPVADTGFNRFGSLLAQQAPAVFAQYGIAVVESKEIEGQTPVNASAPSGAGGVLLPILIVNPVSGKTSSNGRATSTSYVFSALLFDPASRRTIWKASIDTSTWSGQDIVLKHVDKTLYDDAYAASLIKAVIVQLKQDGLI
jgi:hypothetical protein